MSAVALLGLGAAAMFLLGRGKTSAASPVLTSAPPPVPTTTKPPAPAAKPSKPKVTSAAPPPPPGTATLIPSPDGRAPTPATNTITASQRAAALGLADYLRRGGDPGRKGKPSAFVRDMQASMGMASKERDGIYGPKTQARGAALGATMPAPPATPAAPKPAPKPAAKVVPAPKPAAKPSAPKPAAKPAPAPPPAAKAAAKPAAKAKAPAPAKRSAKQAALELADYLKRGGAPGKKGAGQAFVRDAQRDMGMPSKEWDGIMGPKTRAQAKSLGVTIPDPKAAPAKSAALKPAAKAKRTPQQAAKDLAAYAKSAGAQLGNRNRPSQIVHDAQVDMLMPASQVDGIYGPVTAARGKALGVTMPAR